MGSYHHFTIVERGKIEELDKLGFSTRSIAKRLKRHHSSVARELARLGAKAPYKAEIAHANYKANRVNCRPKGKYSAQLGNLLKEKIVATWSPEQIA